MYVYFDQNGTLKEIISDKKFRVGDSKRDKIYVYWEGEHAPISGWIKYRKPNGKDYPVSVEECFFQLGDKLMGKALPTKPARNLKYFSYDHTYEENGEQKVGYLFYEITVPDAVLNSSIDDGEVPTENNMVVARIRFVMDENSNGEIDEADGIETLGALVFSVETNIGILTDSSINETQYNYLVSLISMKIGYGTRSEKVAELPSSGVAGTIYYVNSKTSGVVYDVYFWNGMEFVCLGTTSYDLYSKEEGEDFETAIQALWTAEMNDYKALMNSNFEDYENEIDAKIASLDSLIQAAASGSPKGAYATLAALTNAYPSGTSGIFVVKDNGHWYYWNGTEWADGGQYLSGVQDYDGAFNETSQNALQNGILSKVMPVKETNYYSCKTYFGNPISSTFNGWLIPFTKDICNKKIKSIKTRFSLDPTPANVKCILMDGDKVVLKETSVSNVADKTVTTFNVDFDLTEVHTNVFYIGFATASSSGHLMIAKYEEEFKNEEYVSLVTSIPTAYTTDGGATWVWMTNTTSMQFKNHYFEIVKEDIPELMAKQDAVSKWELSNYSDNDALGFEQHPTVNLFNVNTISKEGQYCNFNNGRFETYPENQYIQTYVNSDYIEVKEDTDYSFTGGNPWSTEYQDNQGITFFDGNKNYISGQAGGQFNVPQKVYHTPAGAKYVVINFQTKAMAQTHVQFEEGNTATTYQPYYGDLYYLNKLKVKADQIEGATANKQYFRCADAYDLVVGDSFELFYKGILEVFNYEEYNVVCQCDIGKCLTRKFAIPSITNAMVGNHSLQITLYSNDGEQLDQKTITLRVVAQATPASGKVILCMGDSLTQGGQWPDEFGRRLTKTTSQTTWGATAPQGLGLANIAFIGKKTSAGGIKYEGYGGWTFADYLSTASSTMYWVTATGNQKTDSDQESVWKDANGVQWQLETIETDRLKFKKYSGTGVMPSSGTLTWVNGGSNTSDIVFTASSVAEGNPFVYNGQIDFSAYCADMGVSTIDEVYILLGWNDATTANPPSMTQCKQFIDLLRAFNPNIKVVLIGLQIPSQEGCGENYVATGIYSKYMELVKYVHNLDDAYKGVAEEYPSGVYSVNLAGQFDTEYNMQFSNTTPNSRNPLSISLQSNGVHPAISGYYQIADVAYRWYNGNK